MRGRGWAYAGAVLGGVASVAANVAHSFVPPAGGTAVGWSPPAGAVVAAVIWPAALLVAVEILARVDWPEGGRWVALRYLGLLPVAVVAAAVSYQHMSGLLAWYGEPGLTSRFGPLAVDGLMTMASAALVATATRAPGLAEASEASSPVPADLPGLPAEAQAGTPVAPDVPPGTPSVPGVPDGVPDPAALRAAGVSWRVISERTGTPVSTLRRRVAQANGAAGQGRHT